MLERRLPALVKEREGLRVEFKTCKKELGEPGREPGVGPQQVIDYSLFISQ